MILKKHFYIWRGDERIVYAEDEIYADAIMAKVLQKVEPRPDVEYVEIETEFLYFQLPK